MGIILEGEAGPEVRLYVSGLLFKEHCRDLLGHHRLFTFIPHLNHTSFFLW